MKRFRIWQLTAILFMCGTSVALTSCSDDDNDDSASSQLTGKWYAEFAQSGTAPSFEGDGEEPYSKVVQYYEFDADGKGYWTRFVLNDYFNDPIYQQGSCIGGRGSDRGSGSGQGCSGCICRDRSGVRHGRRPRACGIR